MKSNVSRGGTDTLDLVLRSSIRSRGELKRLAVSDSRVYRGYFVAVRSSTVQRGTAIPRRLLASGIVCSRCRRGHRCKAAYPYLWMSPSQILACLLTARMYANGSSNTYCRHASLVAARVTARESRLNTLLCFQPSLHTRFPITSS